ncbi:Mu transposase, C-terminal [Klebsiella pneumoniae]|nr:Mu transposase, C-terminal [Klebsiella pneumoniae]
MNMFVAVKELVGIPGLPATAKGIRQLLGKAAGQSSALVRKRQGTKAFEYHIDCLPEPARVAVKQRHYKSVLAQSDCISTDVPAKRSTAIKPRDELEVMRKCPALLERKTNALTTGQKDIADARMVLVVEVMRLMDGGMPRKGAVELVAKESQASSLPPALQKAADKANARKGSTRRGVGKSSLQQWLSDYMAADNASERLATLAPGKIQVKQPETIGWLPDFLAIYRDPRGFNISEAYRRFEKWWAQEFAGQEDVLEAMPSMDAVRRAMKKLPVVVSQKYRVTGSAWRSLNPFIRRDWEQVPVNGVWVGDGHNMKLDVLHPIHGRPFSPEITMVIDARTRFIVGWSLALSENVIAVADAIRHGVQHHGLFGIYYSDNGPGQTGKTLDADVTGILARLGIEDGGVEHRTGIPGNPQGRGIIERPNKGIPKYAAQSFDSYHGKDADKETVRVRKRIAQSAINAVRQGRELTNKQAAALRMIPTWQQLLDVIEEEVNWYNTRHHHSSLPKAPDGKHYTPAAYRRHLLEVEETVIAYPSAVELRDMFRPQQKRTVSRCEVQIFSNLYFSMELLNHHGEEVIVSYDIHDPQTVIIRSLDGTFICDAVWDGNKKAPFAISAKDHSQNQRTKGIIKRAEEKIAVAKEENSLVIEGERPNFGGLLIEPEPQDKEPLFLLETEREEYFKKVNSR